MTVDFTEENVKEYLDDCIAYWRNANKDYSVYYLDAYQSVRISLFGEPLEIEGEEYARSR